MLCIPVAEAAEQTVLQSVVPFEKQGRVFGFAQSVDTLAEDAGAGLCRQRVRGGDHAVQGTHRRAAAIHRGRSSLGLVRGPE